MKQEIKSAAELHERIAELEQRRFQLEEKLSHTWMATKEDLQPMNLLKQGITNLVSVDLTRNKYVNTALGLGLGFLANRFVAGGSKSILRKVAGAALEVGLTNTVSNKLPAWSRIIKHVFSKNGKRHQAE